MADEKIVIQIQDKIDSSIIRKLDSIKTSANAGQAAIDKLQNALGKKNVSNETLKQATAIERLKTATNNAKTSGEKFATQQAKTANALAQATNAQNRAAISATNLGKAQSQAALSALRLQNAQSRASSMPTKGAVSGGGGGLSSLVGMAKGAVGGYLGYQGIQEVTGLASAYTDLQNKLKMVTESEGQLADVTEKVFNIANKTRAPIEDTGKAFIRFDLALKQLGASQSESLRMTETVNKMLIISGATAGEAGSALLQLSQAFNKGKLDGDEFRSVMELMPPVADAIAKKLGVTRGELLKLAPEGKITAQVMREALAGVADDVDEKFVKTIPTLGQMFVVLKNSAIQAFGEMNKESGILSDIAGWVKDIATWFRNSIPELVIFAEKLKLVANEFLTIFGGDLLTMDAFLLGLNSAVETLGYIIALVKTVAFDLNRVGLMLENAATFDFKALKANWNAETPMDKFLDKLMLIENKKGALLIKKEDLENAKIMGIQLETVQHNIERLKKNKGSKEDIVFQMQKATEYENQIKKLKGIELEMGPEAPSRPAKLAGDADKLGNSISRVMPKLESFTKMNDLLAKGAPEYIMPRGADTFSGIINPAQIPTKFAPEPKEDLLSRLGFAPEVRGAVETQFLSLTEKYEFFYSQLDIMRADDLKNKKKYDDAEKKLDIMKFQERSAMMSTFFGNMSSLMQSNSLDSFRIGKAAALAQASIDGVAAVQAAYKAPPGPPWSIALAASVGVQSAMNIAKIASAQPPGFKEGGFTGYAGTSQVAGVVHGQEFVSNAAATSKYRPMLERMNKGGAAIAVTIENYGTSKEFEVQQITPDQVRIIARDEIRTQTPSLVASEVMNPNSRVSKAFNNSTSLQRKRV
jgi:tape measure domain-containing protein